MYYSLIGLLAALILLIENADVLRGRDVALEGSVWRVYRRFLVAVLAYYATDVLWGVFDGMGAAPLLFVDTTVYYVAMGAGVSFWAQYTVSYLREDTREGRMLVGAGRVVSLAILALAVLNVFVPVIFTVDASCAYHALPLRYCLLVVQIALLLLISVHAIASMVRRRTTSETRYRALALFGLIMAVFLAVQLWFPLLPLYTIAYMLGTSLLHAFVVGDEKEGYRRRLEEAERIRELEQTISSLLDNMPGMTFTKDATTGRFLACNQAFAAYAHKASPDEVVGLTDAEIFDAELAAHFVEDDQTALSMDEPLIFLEDVPDGEGGKRQFQTTKLSYTDDSGRRCLLGMCEDVTDMVRIYRENALTKEAYERARSTGIIHAHIAQTLARGYMDLYYVNAETGAFIEYRPDDEHGTLVEVRRDEGFFDLVAQEAAELVHPEDLPAVLAALDPCALAAALDKSGTFVMTYRKMTEEGPVYVSLRASRMADDERLHVFGVTDVDEQMRRQHAVTQMKEERIVHARLHALTGSFIAVYVVVPETGSYREFSATEDYQESFAQAKDGRDFFGSVRAAARTYCHPDDLGRFLAAFTEEHVLAEVENRGFYTLGYRLLKGGRPIYVQLKAAMVEEQEGRRLIVGINDVDAQVRQEQELAGRLAQAQTKANVDALTGVKSKHAYLEAEEGLDRLISEGCQPPFAVAVLDVNDLKRVNDTEGHQAGDQYLRDACRIVCDTFCLSPVFRIGGDEFAVLVQGPDYERVDELVARIAEHDARARTRGGIVISCGMARYEGDDCVAAVLERADQLMYANKASLKAGEPIR